MSRTKERTSDVVNQRERWESAKAKRERYEPKITLDFDFQIQSRSWRVEADGEPDGSSNQLRTS
ncbi:unnamed protein product [Camellia sinensis]